MKSSFKKSDIIKYMIIALVAFLSKQVTDQLFGSADDKKIEQVANGHKQDEKKRIEDTGYQWNNPRTRLCGSWIECEMGDVQCRGGKFMGICRLVIKKPRSGGILLAVVRKPTVFV